MFKDKWFIFAVIAAVFLGLCIVFSGGVYTMGQAKEGIFYRINRFTGETWLGNNVDPRKVDYNPPPPQPPPSHMVDDAGIFDDRKDSKPVVDDLSLGAPKTKDK